LKSKTFWYKILTQRALGSHITLGNKTYIFKQKDEETSKNDKTNQIINYKVWVLTTKGAQCHWYEGQSQQKIYCSERKLQGLIGVGITNMPIYTSNGSDQNAVDSQMSGSNQRL